MSDRRNRRSRKSTIQSNPKIKEEDVGCFGCINTNEGARKTQTQILSKNIQGSEANPAAVVSLPALPTNFQSHKEVEKGVKPSQEAGIKRYTKSEVAFVQHKVQDKQSKVTPLEHQVIQVQNLHASPVNKQPAQQEVKKQIPTARQAHATAFNPPSIKLSVFVIPPSYKFKASLFD